MISHSIGILLKIDRNVTWEKNGNPVAPFVLFTLIALCLNRFTRDSFFILAFFKNQCADFLSPHCSIVR